MAKFVAEIPSELIKELEELAMYSEQMCSEMTRAGAEVVRKNVVANMKRSFKKTDNLEKCLKITRTYKTPSDDGINTKVGFYGYFTNENGQEVPAALVANARERGTSRGETPKPFFRKSFKKKDIEQEMLKVQERYLPKD